MAKREPKLVEVLFIPLPANEIEDRRRRLRALLLTGAIRVAQEQAALSGKASKSLTADRLVGQIVQK